MPWIRIKKSVALELHASDTPTERARKITEIAFTHMFTNATMVAIGEQSIALVAEALAHYASLDSDAKQITAFTTSGHNNIAYGCSALDVNETAIASCALSPSGPPVTP